ncbi:unnamed protein product, partial [Discosporangium mesarthrocarpum]
MPPVLTTPGVQWNVGDTNFTISSTIPPMVGGELAGEIEVFVPFIYLKMGILQRLSGPRNARSAIVRMQWWGEAGPGTIFKPNIMTSRDSNGERARGAVPSKATCVLFPVRCGSEGLTAYLNDMGHIALDILLHDSRQGKLRQVARCVIPMGGWDGQLHGLESGKGRTSLADGYFPILETGGNRHAGELCLQLHVCLGPASGLHRILAASMAPSFHRGEGEVNPAIKALGVMGSSNADLGSQGNVGKLATSGPRGGGGEAAEVARGTSALLWGSLDSEFPSGAITPALGQKFPFEDPGPGPGPLSSFQLNEALANFDDSNALPMWPTQGTLYRPPESRGEAAPQPPQPCEAKVGDAGGGGSTNDGNSGGVDDEVALLGQAILSRAEKLKKEMDRATTTLAPTATASLAEGAQTEVSVAQAGKREECHSVARSAGPGLAGTNRAAAAARAGGGGGGGGGNGRHGRSPFPPTGVTPAGRGLTGGESLGSPLLLGSTALGTLGGVGIGGLFDALSDDGSGDGSYGGDDDREGEGGSISAAQGGVQNMIRDTRTRRHEGQLVDLLLGAAGPAPSSMAFPTLAALERARSDALGAVRFLRIRLHRLVMFSSETSAKDGHGWQFRFRLPPFADPPAAGSLSLGSGRGHGGLERDRGQGGVGVVVSVPVPARGPATALGGKGKKRVGVGGVRGAGGAGGQGQGAAAGNGNSMSMLRVRRGFGAADLVVGETPLLEEVVCALHMSDACVQCWTDSSLEILLVDGKSRSPPSTPGGPGGISGMGLGLGDRAAGVAKLRLRDVLLSPDLGLVATLDLTQVQDFWEVENARAGARTLGVRGQGSRPLGNNPHRGEPRGPGARGGGTGGRVDRPLVLGERAIGTLSVSLELVPGEGRGGDGGGILPPGGAAAASDSADAADCVGQLVGVGKESQVTGGGRVRDGARGGREEDSKEEADDTGLGLGLRRGDLPGLRSGGSVAHLNPGPSPKPLQETEATTKAKAKIAPIPDSHITDDSVFKQAQNSKPGFPLDYALPVLLHLEEVEIAAHENGLESVRVSYALFQVRGAVPQVVHRSVQGTRGRKNPTANLPQGNNHKKENTGGVGGSLSLEATQSTVGGLGVSRERGEFLLGLAKVPLTPFAKAQEHPAGLRSGLGIGSETHGQVQITNPFSGRTVGQLQLFLALGGGGSYAHPSTELQAEERQPLQPAALGGGGGAARGEESGSGSGMLDVETCHVEAGARSRKAGEVGAEEELAPPIYCPEVGDSVEDLSRLLNSPRRGTESRKNRSVHLVRHVLEMSAVGELPVGEGLGGGNGADDPIGCTVVYSLPDEGVSAFSKVFSSSPPACTAASMPRRSHYLWWDADSAILNSRARHAVKMPAPAETMIVGDDGGGGGGVGQATLLDWIFGPGDVVFSLFWSTGAGAGVGPVGEKDKPNVIERERVGEGDGEGGGRGNRGGQQRCVKQCCARRMGTAVLRRSDLVGLVQQRSACLVLHLPIEPRDKWDCCTDCNNGVGAGQPPASTPTHFPLSLSYRREPTAVARRKQGRAWEGDLRSVDSTIAGDINALGPPSTPTPSLAERRRDHAQSSRASGADSDSWNPVAAEEGSGRARGPPEEGEQGDGVTAGGYTERSDKATLLHRSSVTEHLLPARTRVCLCLGRVDL